MDPKPGGSVDPWIPKVFDLGLCSVCIGIIARFSVFTSLLYSHCIDRNADLRKLKIMMWIK